MIMNFKNPFNFFFSKNNRAARSSVNSAPDSIQDGWDSLAAMNPNTQSDVTFDDLGKEVPFAGASVTDSSVTSNHVLPDESNLDTTDTSEQHESMPSPELQAFKNFFKIDLRIKKELMQAAPNPADDYDEESRMAYVEEAYRTFKGFRADFAQINRDFGFGDYIGQQSDAFFKRGAEHFALSNYGPGVANQIYKSEFTDLRRDFVEKVKAEYKGYALFGDLSPLINESQSVNELLHAYHSYIMNNNRILQRVPPIAEKETSYGYPITLRGEDTPLSRQIFDSISTDMNIDDTDIIAADGRIMMMVSGRGHALTISAEPDGAQSDKMWVEYNIPKLCNVEMIKVLPGLSGYTKNGARGGFFAPRDELGSKIADFIAQVPTDEDMLKPGGTAYRGPNAE